MAKEKEVQSDLQAAWEAFLATAEEQRKKDGTLHIFLAQKERGEFKEIPESFVREHGIRVAAK